MIFSSACQVYVKYLRVNLLICSNIWYFEETAEQLKIRDAILLCDQILPALVISSFQSSISYSYMILNKAQETELIVVAYKGIVMHILSFESFSCLACDTNSNKQ